MRAVDTAVRHRTMYLCVWKFQRGGFIPSPSNVSQSLCGIVLVG